MEGTPNNKPTMEVYKESSFYCTEGVGYPSVGVGGGGGGGGGGGEQASLD